MLAEQLVEEVAGGLQGVLLFGGRCGPGEGAIKPSET